MAAQLSSAQVSSAQVSSAQLSSKSPELPKMPSLILTEIRYFLKKNYFLNFFG